MRAIFYQIEPLDGWVYKLRNGTLIPWHPLQVMTTQPKRAPICGILSIAASASSWLIIYVFIRLHPNPAVNVGAAQLRILQVYVPCCGLGGFVFAIVALLRRERYWVLPLVSIFLVLALVGLVCFIVGGVDEKRISEAFGRFILL
jgi:hypothetical protein